MNANELANELVEWYEDYKGRFDLIDEAIVILRQQQAEIEALKDIMVAAIKAGDWIVDGACDPDQYIGDRL